MQDCLVPKKSLNVEMAISVLDGSAMDLDAALTNLVSRLQPLLKPPMPQSEVLERMRGESEISERILVNSDRVSEFKDRISDLIERL